MEHFVAIEAFVHDPGDDDPFRVSPHDLLTNEQLGASGHVRLLLETGKIRRASEGDVILFGGEYHHDEATGKVKPIGKTKVALDKLLEKERA